MLMYWGVNELILFVIYLDEHNEIVVDMDAEF